MLLFRVVSNFSVDESSYEANQRMTMVSIEHIPSGSNKFLVLTIFCDTGLL